jgi:hypothetical protein
MKRPPGVSAAASRRSEKSYRLFLPFSMIHFW